MRQTWPDMQRCRGKWLSSEIFGFFVPLIFMLAGNFNT